MAQIPPAQWSPRQLSLLLTAAQHLQAQVAAAPAPPSPHPIVAELADLRGRMEQEQARTAQLQVQLLECDGQLEGTQAALEEVRGDLDRARGRVTAMESSKFWQLRAI